uniref:Ovule protein n=1 Tax=Caenorhabditis tropicalis TaxID=1561998 RepID=A0A1I7UDC4_9PELO
MMFQSLKSFRETNPKKLTKPEVVERSISCEKRRNHALSNSILFDSLVLQEKSFQFHKLFNHSDGFHSGKRKLEIRRRFCFL